MSHVTQFNCVFEPWLAMWTCQNLWQVRAKVEKRGRERVRETESKRQAGRKRGREGEREKGRVGKR